MPRTTVKSHQIFNEGVKREDLNSTTSGQAVAKKIIGGSGITLDSTGVDTGTGDVTVNFDDTAIAVIDGGVIT